MSAVIGRKGWVNIALETNPGEPVVPGDNYIPFLECSLKGKMALIPDLAARGIRDEQGENSEIGRKSGGDALKVNLDPTLAPILLGMVMGDFGTPFNEGDGVRTHTFVRKANNIPKSASIIYDRASIDRQLFPYAVVDNLEISFADAMATLAANLLSRFPVTSVSGSLTTVSGTLFTFRDAQVRIGANLASAEGATPLRIKDFSLTINNNDKLDYVINNKVDKSDVDSIVAGNFGVSGRFSLNFEDSVQRDIFRNLNKRAMIITLTGNGIGNNMSEFIKFRIAKMRFEDYKPELPIDDIATEGIDFIGEYSSGDAKTMDIVVRNRVSSY